MAILSYSILLLFVCIISKNARCDAWVMDRSHRQNRVNPEQKIAPLPTKSFLGAARHQRRQSSRRETAISASEAAWTATITQSAVDLNENTIFQVASPTVLLLVALAIGIAANGWIQRLLSGEQGLGSFLSDGKGFNKSGFKPITGDQDRAVSSDPLPWLRLPKLDFVDVAGQQELEREDFEKGRLPNNVQYNEVLAKLESLREKMNQKLADGKVEEALVLRKELEETMKENDIQYFKD